MSNRRRAGYKELSRFLLEVPLKKFLSSLVKALAGLALLVGLTLADRACTAHAQEAPKPASKQCKYPPAPFKGSLPLGCDKGCCGWEILPVPGDVRCFVVLCVADDPASPDCATGWTPEAAACRPLKKGEKRGTMPDEPGDPQEQKLEVL